MAQQSSTSELPDHHCPVCGSKQRVFLRYPWYICKECVALAEDGDGRRLNFGNVSFSGGFCFGYVDEPDTASRVCGSVVCLIHRRPVYVTEARFGGIVAQPLMSSRTEGMHLYDNVDLTRRANS